MDVYTQRKIVADYKAAVAGFKPQVGNDTHIEAVKLITKIDKLIPHVKALPAGSRRKREIENVLSLKRQVIFMLNK